LTSFSEIFMVPTKTAALSGGDAFGSHTTVFANGPLTQSGYIIAVVRGRPRTTSPALRTVDGDVFITIISMRQATS